MSDHTPIEIQLEIIKRVPIKSIIRFRSVSKPWKSLIDSSEFIAYYKIHHSQPHRLLVSYRVSLDSELEYVLIDDEDETFPQRKCYLNVPLFFKLIKDPKILGNSHSILCLHGRYQDGYDFPNTGFGVVVLWNPSIRKSVVIEVPNHDQLCSPYTTVIGFWVCPHTNDPKLVKINFISSRAKVKDISCIPLQVEVFTLSSRGWRMLSRNLPRKSIFFSSSHILVDGYIYWLAFDRTIVDDFRGYNLIISFDLASEEFSEIYLPDYRLAQGPRNISSVSKLRDSLVVLEWCGIGLKPVFAIWMMEHGVPNTFRKLFTIDTPNAAVHPFLGFRQNGEALLQTITDKGSAAVEVYEPSSKHIKDVGIYGELDSFFASSYLETLLLLDQPDSSILFYM